MQSYLIKNADGKVTKMQSKVDPNSLPLPEGMECLGLEIEFEMPDSRHLKVVDNTIVEDTDSIREAKLDAIRALRIPLIVEADVLMNIAYDNGSGIAASKAYRQALRDCTEAIKADMSLLDAIEPADFEFPAKP